MSDTTQQKPGMSGGADRQDAKGGSLSDKAGELAREVRQQASGIADQASSQMQEQMSGLSKSAKEAASNATGKLRSAVEEQKNVGADYVSGMAGAVRQAAEGFDQQLPQAAQYIRQAAQQIESLSLALRRRDLSELVENLQDFARRQPTAFLGATFLAGFAAMRFLKSSMPQRAQMRPGGDHAQRYGAGQPYSGGQYGHAGGARDLSPPAYSPPTAPELSDRSGL